MMSTAMCKTNPSAWAFLALAACSTQAADRPPITGVANIAVKVKSLDEARKFYSAVVGMEEVFTTKGGKVSFKVNDHQYVEVSPELKTETEERLIRIGFETADARKLRDYLESKGIAVPSKIGKDPNGNLSLEVKDPDGHLVQFVQYMPGSVQTRNFGRHVPDTRLSDHILHVGVWVTDPVRADGFYKGYPRLQAAMERRQSGSFRLDFDAGSRGSRLGGIHGVADQAHAPAARDDAPLLSRHDGHSEGLQNRCRARLSAAEAARDTARWAMAAAAVRQRLYENGDDGPQAGRDSVLLAHEG
jgi:catechol 2,3-dioxygenase-like lactoylglutathione lyase family enzyme